MCAGTAAATFRGKHQALCRNNPQPATAADTFELNPLIGFHIPDAVVKIPKKHAVIAGGHVSAFDSLRQVVTH